jgi:MerR family transcriptional regulator/heat shock protein HspR
MVNVHPQTLREFERLGFILPHRTAGGVRRYTPDDIERLKFMRSLAAEGVNNAGIRKILQLTEENNILRRQLQINSSVDNVFAAAADGQVSVTKGKFKLIDRVRFYRQQRKFRQQQAESIRRLIALNQPKQIGY